MNGDNKRLEGRTKIGDFHRNEGRDSFPNRRRQADWVVKAAAILSLIAWLVAVAAILIFEIASPQRGLPIIDGAIDASGPRMEWAYDILPYVLVLLVVSVIVCVTAFIFNAMRMRRKTDKYRKSIIIIGAATIIGTVVFLIRFWPYIF